jgi:hypothetical protein
MGFFAFYEFVCDLENCDTVAHFVSCAKGRAIKQARAAGWAISTDRQRCYCPKCAPHKTYTGVKGFRYFT